MGLLSRLLKKKQQAADITTPIGSKRDRMIPLYSVLVAVAIGLPLWWKQTEVYRANLPSEQMIAWDSNPPPIQIPFNFMIEWDDGLEPSSDLVLDWDTKIENRINSALMKDANNDRLRTKLPVSLKFNLQRSTGKNFDTLKPNNYLVSMKNHEKGQNSDKHPLLHVTDTRKWIAYTTKKKSSETLEIFEKSVLNYLVTEQGKLRQSVVTKDTQGSSKDLHAINYSPKYSLVFSLMNEDPESQITTWDIEGALKQYMYPLLNKLSIMSDFKVQSQILRYTALPIPPIASNNGTYITSDMLPNFINSAEWNMASIEPVAPTIHFLLYIPKTTSRPLVIKDSNLVSSKTNGFMISQWGGIHISNPPSDKQVYKFGTKELQPTMEVFVSQLRELLGIQEVSITKGQHKNVKVDELSPSNGVTDLELDSLMCRWLIQNIRLAASTLGSLDRMIISLTNMVVHDSIKDLVSDALNRLDQTVHVLSTGELSNAFTNSAFASGLAEKAFFDPDMVGMLYFPDEHKYAIYLPFFLPATMPVLSIIGFRLRQWKKNRGTKKDRSNPSPLKKPGNPAKPHDE
ncbi:GPI transamidase component [Mycoemilia scoparia]|uniref:GPI transamidase component n=1 Tax=Mycoemilia scoparia TaxID=417184 RepID=A0A9W8AAU6_9FUNG|nr:GPI transamidase component [Mycoemilia scoparia]